MQVIRGTPQLAKYLKTHGCQPGLLADTGFLYALSDTDDRLYKQALEVFELLEEHKVCIYANVISRMEFIDLIFRKQITIGAVETFQKMNATTAHKGLFTFLKSIRDENTAQRKDNQSYRVNEGKLKKLRVQLELASGPAKWKEFCKAYVGKMLFNEWIILEEELGLNFIEVLEGGTSELFHSPLLWADMVQIMGEQGLRGPDAMIANLFSKSKFPLLITSDSDFEHCFNNPLQNDSKKAIFIL